MLRLTLEIVPFGEEARARIIALLNLHNDNTGNGAVGNYEWDLTYDNGNYVGSVKGYPRKNGALNLARIALTQAVIALEKDSASNQEEEELNNDVLRVLQELGGQNLQVEHYKRNQLGLSGVRPNRIRRRQGGRPR